MNFSKLQYITDSPLLAEQACVAGVKWIQARIKNKPYTETKNIAESILNICKKYGAVCIINDFPEIALEIGADGVHVGKEDNSVEEVRRIFGSKHMLIGGTSNTIADVKKLVLLKVNYIGLGPFRFTSTKEKLSPVLGTEGYRLIMEKLKEERIVVPPVYAIGGILTGDVKGILETGVYGVAVSGVISNALEKEKLVKNFYEVLEQN